MQQPDLDRTCVLSDPSEDGAVSLLFFAFNTVNKIKVWIAESNDERSREAAIEQLRDDLLSVYRRSLFFEEIFSRTRPDSDIARINTAAGQAVIVHDETAELVAIALEYCRISEGRFDITAGSLTSLWDFANQIIPQTESLLAAKSHVDWKKVKVEGNTVTVSDPKARIDLGGVAKGYIADDIAASIKDKGYPRALIDLGGNLLAIGARPDGSPWRIGVRDPDPDKDYLGVIAIQDASVVTSGLYERGFSYEGRYYHHIIDLTTGYPSDTDIISSTIIAARSTDCDGLSTIPILIGRERGLELLESIDDVEGILVDNEHRIFTTSGFNDRYHFELV